MTDKLERIYTIPLTKAYETVRQKRAKRAVQIVRDFMGRHMKSSSVLLSNALNGYIWQYSREKPPRRVKVRGIRQDTVVNVYLSDEKLETPKKEEKKDGVKQETKKPEPKKEAPQEVKKETPKAVPTSEKTEKKTSPKVEPKPKPADKK